MAFEPIAHIKSKLIGADRNRVLIAKEGMVSGRQRAVELFDDFLGDALNANWAVAKGSDGACADFAHLTGVNGLISGATGADAGGTMALNGVQLHNALQWKANSGNLTLEARVKLSAITNVALFVGFTDQIGSLEAPVISAASANTITTNATDAVGFMFDTSMTADNFWLVGVANDTDATAQNTAVAPVADTFHRLRVELGSSGAADFYIDGARVGTTMAGGVTATVALTPVIAAFSRAAASRTVTVDYIQVLATRT
jgi:hypothetical protein